MKFIGLTTKYKVSRERLKAGISVGIIVVICAVSVVTVNALIQAREDDYKERSDERFARIVFESEETEAPKKSSTDPVKTGSAELEAPSSDIKVFETTEQTLASDTDDTSVSAETSEGPEGSETSGSESLKTEAMAAGTEKETAASSETTSAPEPAYTETKLIKFVYASDKLNVRSEPNTDCEVVKTIEKGSGIDVIAVTSNGWYHTYNDNYVLKEYCQDTPVIITATPTPVPTKAPKTEETKSTTEATTAATTAATEATTEATTTAATTQATEATTRAPEQPSSSNGMTYYGNCKITFYGPQPNGDGTFNTGTATGATCVQGETVAADWSIFPAGTRIYIANDPLGGDGYYTVQDRGSGVVGDHIDIYADAGESMSTTTAEVYIVN